MMTKKWIRREQSMIPKFKKIFSDLRNDKGKLIDVVVLVTFIMVSISLVMFNYDDIKEIMPYPEEEYILMEEEAEKMLLMPDLLERLANGTATEYSYDMKVTSNESFSNVEITLKGNSVLKIQIDDLESRKATIERLVKNPIAHILLMSLTILLAILLFTVVVLFCEGILVLVALFLIFLYRKIKNRKDRKYDNQKESSQ